MSFIDLRNELVDLGREIWYAIADTCLYAYFTLRGAVWCLRCWARSAGRAAERFLRGF